MGEFLMTEMYRHTNPEKPASELNIRELALAVIALKETAPESHELLDVTVRELERLQRLNVLLGMLAPGGTAPRTGVEQLWIQAADNSDESPVLHEIRMMLKQHWGDWTPAIREADGLPPIQQQG